MDVSEAAWKLIARPAALTALLKLYHYQDARQSKHQLALYGRYGVIAGSHRGFEEFVVLRILKRGNHGLGGEAVTYGITMGVRRSYFYSMLKLTNLLRARYRR